MAFRVRRDRGGRIMAEKKKYESKKNWLAELINKQVSLAFLDGKSMLGKVVDVTQYEVILKKENVKNPIIVAKHSIKYIYEREEN